MFSVFYPQLTLIFGSLLDLNCTCSFHKAVLFISPCAAEMSVCLPLQQKVMSRGGLGNFLHIRDIVTSAMGCVFSTGCNSAPFSVQLYQGHPISLYKERVQEDLGRQSWRPFLVGPPSVHPSVCSAFADLCPAPGHGDGPDLLDTERLHSRPVGP